jgi:CRISPR-associated RAMP protein (TIGR02581 family)
LNGARDRVSRRGNVVHLERRYVFTGRLAFTTALHIGGGTGTLSPSDSPVVRGPDGLPFIPGSSFKGSFRSTVEKLALAAGLRSCGLLPQEGCPGAEGDAQRDLRHQAAEERWTEAKLVTELEQRLCDTCKLFGSVFRSSRIFFDDLPLVEWAGATQIRDGVGIDRDTEKARDRLKYDFEVVPPDAAFSMRVSLENPSTTDLALACIGFSEFVGGFGSLGGKRSRGLGRCELRDLRVFELDLTVTGSERAERLKNYLLGRTLEEKMLERNAADFLDEQIRSLIGG